MRLFESPEWKTRPLLVLFITLHLHDSNMVIGDHTSHNGQLYNKAHDPFVPNQSSHKGQLYNNAHDPLVTWVRPNLVPIKPVTSVSMSTLPIRDLLP